MPRSLRSDPDDGWHHVMNRGVDRMIIFRGDADRRWFLRLLKEAAAECGVEVVAYCLVGTHFHLLVHCPRGGLSRFMQLLGASYAQVFNVRHERDGALFRGRFASKQVDSDEYTIQVVRYIHRNSLDIGVSPDAWPWSSYAAYAGRIEAPNWLSTTVVRPLVGVPAEHRRFVATPQPHDERMYFGAEPEALHIAWRSSLTAVTVNAIEKRIDELSHRLNARQRRDAVLLVALDSQEIRPVDLVEALGVGSTASVRSRLHRARQRLSSDPLLAAVVNAASRSLFPMNRSDAA